MSDPLRFGREDILLLTGWINPQVIRTAEMIGIAALLSVRSKMPAAETIALAQEARIPLLATKFARYEASGLLYRAARHRSVWRARLSQLVSNVSRTQ